ncbi:hypothetical protein [Pseudomonas extremaustralis]|uniref:hypothetical protein n=1 Tax=Pseudomonas extremaustralis TaxID=359110 RepID=UPI00285A35E0|nr:hypothetical protein [Pseudomonas extremaustralis]MDR6581634.1 hypothetical protein [Pseudomonas extremaustralis]
MIGQIIEFMKTVPDVIWSGIVASAITLFGVMISNKSNSGRLLLQLNHDANEKSKERMSKLRHDVYLKAIEDIEITNIKLGTLVSRDFTKIDMTLELQAITASMAKVKLVAEPETTKLAGELSAEFGVVFLKLLPWLAVVQNAKADIEINSSSYDSSFAEASRLQLDMQRFHEEGRQDWAVYQTLESYYKFKSGQSEEYSEALARAYEIHGEKLGEFNALLLPEIKGLSKVQLKLMIAIRKDLGIACDVAELQRQLERHWAVMEAGYGNVMKEMKGE